MSTNASAKPALVMQLVVDGAAASALTWSKGVWMAQAAHAAVAAIQSSAQSADTQEYIASANLAAMHKVVLQTPASGKAQMDLRQLSAKLHAAQSTDDAFPHHWLWIEQPEDTPTCLAIAPNRKPAELKKILRACTLFKD